MTYRVASPPSPEPSTRKTLPWSKPEKLFALSALFFALTTLFFLSHAITVPENRLVSISVFLFQVSQMISPLTHLWRARRERLKEIEALNRAS